MNKNLHTLITDLVENQHAISDNKGYGYHGTVDPKLHNGKSMRKDSPMHDEEHARNHHYKTMHGTVRSLTGEHPKVVKHYLDSKHGRHLADVHNDNTERRLAVSHVHNYIKKDFAKFKKHYKPDLFEADMGVDADDLQEATYTPKSFDKQNDHPSKSDKTFIKGVHGDESEHVSVIKSTAKVSDEHAKKIAHHPDYHEHAYKYRHDFARGGSNGYDNGVKKLAGTHPHHPDKAGAIKEQLDEVFFNHRTAATHGVVHPETAKHAKVGHETDFYHSTNGDKISGVCVKNDGKSVHFRANQGEKRGSGPVHKFRVASNYPGLHEEEQLDEISQQLRKNYVDKAREDSEQKHKEGAESEARGHYVASAAAHAKANDRSQKAYKAAQKLKEGEEEGDEETIEEMSDSGSFSAGDRVIVKAPNSPHNNKRGTYVGVERGRHVVKHGDGSRSIHGSGALLKESMASRVKHLVKEGTKSADKKPETVRTANGKLITKMVTRKQDVVDSGGKDDGNETENKVS